MTCEWLTRTDPEDIVFVWMVPRGLYHPLGCRNDYRDEEDDSGEIAYRSKETLEENPHRGIQGLGFSFLAVVAREAISGILTPLPV